MDNQRLNRLPASVTDETSTTQTRTHDDQNRLVGVSGASAPTFSPNGEMLSDETGQTLAYDAWGRLVAVDPTPGPFGLVGDERSYAYDALNRKMTVQDLGGNVAVWYHSQQWQVLEERSAATGDVETQYVWSPVYVDAMILRDRDTDPNSAGLEERVYVTHDANFNVTSIIGKDGTDWEVIERYIYDPYGERTVLNADWTVDTDGLSDFTFVHGHQGLRYDPATGLYDNRFRFYRPSLGRFMTQDPLGYVDGANMYLAYLAAPVQGSDPAGLKTSHSKLADGSWIRIETEVIGTKRITTASPSKGPAYDADVAACKAKCAKFSDVPDYIPMDGNVIMPSTSPRQRCEDACEESTGNYDPDYDPTGGGEIDVPEWVEDTSTICWYVGWACFGAAAALCGASGVAGGLLSPGMTPATAQCIRAGTVIVGGVANGCEAACNH